MENAVDALIMAGSVLLLIIALTVSISSFSSLKTQVDDIIQASEEVDLAKDEAGNYINYIENADDIRTVGVETVISSIRRMKKESYTVYIYGTNIVSDVESTSNQELKNTLITNTKEQKYGDTTLIPSSQEVIKFEVAGSGYQSITNSAMEELYGYIKGSQFKEYLGIYQEDEEGVSSANKQTYRIITFVEQST